MELNPVTGFGVTAPTTTEVSPDSLRSLVHQIEAELYCSEVYNIALKSLQKMLGQAASKAEIVIKAVGREAIQLALKQIAKQETAIICTTESPSVNESISVTAISSDYSSPSSVKQSPKKTKSTPPEVQISVVSPLGFIAGYQPPNTTSESSEETSTSSDISSWDNTSQVQSKRQPLTQAEINQKIHQKQKIYLQEIGEELRKARESYHLSLQQMHYFTLVPLHHLEALEQGELERLPEDIYIRGFICRVANALGLEGGKIAASFPCLEFSGQVGQYGSKVDVDSEFYLNSVHLYLGYAAILAGSMGGFAWLSQQSVPDVTLPPDIQNLLEQKSPQSHRQESSTPIPGRQSDHNQIQIGLDFSPPEMMDGVSA
ncbi:helix-turn-helix domain-containing protein [Planktothrix mougeotii]|uniref:Helix-turn-helix domain-containing protein n=1 Tax=Planktothrix mougeotii LEGE 06226 TaxID=1828728 RepID=A0ABR9U7V5_9CYAN|nr:helix-turn-helix domain-containing protein [Planktothrix mougeotii]MBE9142543.1 helix-turn-helix domain-containing protein [Planktothrix mougeotii LEGE 06226]